jgi:plexin B
MLEDGEEGGLRFWHLVKAAEEPEGAKARRSSLRERERERARAKAIPEIYLTRLLSMKVSEARGIKLWGRLAKEP